MTPLVSGPKPWLSMRYPSGSGSPMNPEAGAVTLEITRSGNARSETRSWSLALAWLVAAAVMRTAWVEFEMPSFNVAMARLTFVWPASIVTLAGTVASFGSLEVSATTRLFVGGVLRVTMAVVAGDRKGGL